RWMANASHDPTQTVDVEACALALIQAAERAVEDSASPAPSERETWHRFLDVTRRSPFLLALPDAAQRSRWAELCFRVVRRSNYTMEDMLRQRSARHPDRPLFRHADAPPGAAWTYAQVHRQARRFAATLLRNANTTPHVAFWFANSIQGACCDIACLAFDIPNTPMSVHADDEQVAAIHAAVQFDIVVTDSLDRYARLVALRRNVARSFTILRLDATEDELEQGDDRLLRAQAVLGREEIEAVLEARVRLGVDDAATVMFTPGPAGTTKGVVFSPYNLITKRFARAAALPCIGEEELLLCYLPLFHTFGRFLEMLGALFWGGTYVLSSGPSIESLLAGLRVVRPTSFVSIPLRWMQIHRHILAEAGDGADEHALQRACTRVTGGRLRWGLSAAGYLAPHVFRFFHRMGIALCSGFGMTEATGGVTMTPPDEYVDNSVGVPLPGMRVKLAHGSELLIGGPYVARPLGEPPGDEHEERWTPTGDLFHVRNDGHFEIFDKVKDIYKNTRGQTVAPRRVENHFASMPEADVMLVGDGRDDNTLLFLLKGGTAKTEELRAVFHERVLAANRQLAPYERVVDFAIVDEPLGEGERRADGSLNRKAVLARHRRSIEPMYTQRARSLLFGNVRVRVPRWLFREIGILVDDLVAGSTGLTDRALGRSLRIQELAPGYVRVGNLAYETGGQTVDLGLLARQPAAWIGNAGLTDFFPCKQGWDVSIGGLDVCPCLPVSDLPELDDVQPLTGNYDDRLRDVHRLTVLAFAANGPLASTAVERLGEQLSGRRDRLDRVITRRLRSLADHPHAPVRSRAFRALLAYGGDVEGVPPMHAFLASGRSFLSEDTLTFVAARRAERAPLQTLREALQACRDRCPLASTTVRQQLEQVFELLVHVSRRNIALWSASREELATWSLVDDRDLAQTADACLARLHRPLSPQQPSKPVRVGWQEQTTLMAELGQHPSDAQLQDALDDRGFLAHAAAVLYGCSSRPFRNARELVVTREPAPNLASVRVGWSGNGVHADVVLTAVEEERDAAINARWRLALHGASTPWPLLPRTGLWHERFHVVSMEMLDAPTVWDRIRVHATRQPTGTRAEEHEIWRALFVRGMAACMRVWAATGQSRTARNLGPSNVLMNLPDLAEHACVRELEIGPEQITFSEIVDALDREFYERTARHYPWYRDRLKRTWLFDACVEALGPEAAEVCIEQLARERNDTWGVEAKRYVGGDAVLSVVPLAAIHARSAYERWLASVPGATVRACAQTASALCRAHALERFPDLVRYRFFRQTVFAQQPATVGKAFDALLAAITCRGCKATDLVELTELQGAIPDKALREVLRSLVFPEARPTLQMGMQHRERRRDPRGLVEVAGKAGRKHTVRISRAARDVSTVLHAAWRLGHVRSYWSDELAAVVLDEAGSAAGGALLRHGSGGDIVFDGPYFGAHLRSAELDRVVVDAVIEHARAQNAGLVRS
ncbi:MAG: AMP-binding protein, partial [Myxococcota bacterium]